MGSTTQFWLLGGFMYGILVISYIYLIIFTISSVKTGKGLEDMD